MTKIVYDNTWKRDSVHWGMIYLVLFSVSIPGMDLLLARGAREPKYWST
jgi:hypothetical protein